MSALWQALRSWLRWHLPITRETALRFAEQEAGTYYNVLAPKVGRICALLARAYEEEGLEPPPEFRSQPKQPARPEPEPEPEQVTQRDLDDAVAELIREARQQFGRGGAR